MYAYLIYVQACNQSQHHFLEKISSIDCETFLPPWHASPYGLLLITIKSSPYDCILYLY